MAALFTACGGGGDDPVPVAPQQEVGPYLQALPKWEQFSPAVPDEAPNPKLGTTPEKTTERIDKLLPGGVIESQQYACLTTTFSMKSTPEKIVMFSPDRELLWPGALIQGKSHRDGVGSLLGLPIRERAPIKVSIPSLATADNFRLVSNPDQAEVNHAIGQMIDSVPSTLVPPSSIQFTLRDFTSEQSFALQAGMSGKYMGFSASASASVDRSANERTVMVYFVEKMFEVVVEPPPTPLAFFSADFTRDKLDEQVAMGRIGPGNLPVYVSNIVYGRMFAFTFTSTASLSDIKAALNAAYKGLGSFSANAQIEYKKTLSEAKISITSVGGPAAATVETIASGKWQDYFGVPAPLSTAYPLSYTFRNLGDGSIAKVQEGTEYKVKECQPAGGGSFILDSFEVAATTWSPQPVAAPKTTPITPEWRDPATSQSIFYGYMAVNHMNSSMSDPDWTYNVGYVMAPAHFLGDKRAFYRGELSFWYKPGEQLTNQAAGTVRHCWTVWYLFVPVTRCVDLPAALPATMTLKPSDQIYVYDSLTTADQIVMRGGGTDALGTILTLTYNPKEDDRRMTQSWQKLVLSLSNDDNAGRRLCADSDPRGCWLIEERIATEEEIQYVLGSVKELRVRASYPVYATQFCSVDEATLPAGTLCPSYVDYPSPVPLGFVGGYFDEIKITKPAQ
jgi:hypothetical protein